MYAVGDSVSATGYYDPTTGFFRAASMKLLSTPAPAPTPFVAPSTIPYAHLTNFAYYPPSSTCSTWGSTLSFAYPDHYNMIAALHACGVKTISYISPSMPQTGEDDLKISYGSTANPSTTPAPSPGPYYGALAVDGTGKLVYTYNGSGLLMDPRATPAPAYYSTSINDAIKTAQTYNSGQLPDLIFSDNSDEVYGASANPAGYTGQTQWSAATSTLLGKVTETSPVPLILNTLGLPTAFSVPSSQDSIANIMLPVKSNAIVGGAMLENTYWGNKNLSGYDLGNGTTGSAWQSQEDMELADITSHKFFNALANGTFTTYVKNAGGAGAAASLGARMYVYASTLLTYDPSQFCGLPAPGCLLYGEEMQPASKVDAYPETSLIPLYPVQSAQSSVDELRVGTSTLYKREFLGCYYRKAFVGKCAIVVNMSNSATVAVSLPQYTHSFVLVGGAIADGGTANTTGPAVTQLGPNSAAILLP